MSPPYPMSLPRSAGKSDGRTFNPREYSPRTKLPGLMCRRPLFSPFLATCPGMPVGRKDLRRYGVAKPYNSICSGPLSESLSICREAACWPGTLGMKLNV
jgi:hypothetical protein